MRADEIVDRQLHLPRINSVIFLEAFSRIV